MKKVSLLVLVCMLLSLGLTACEGHTCTFDKAVWSYDATNHYHACTCGQKSDTATHADDNNDGACDVCGIIMSNKHVFDKEWTSDETGHWHASLCGHTVIDGKAEHTANALGKCSVCGYKVNDPVMATIADAFKIANFSQSAVKNGLYTQISSVGEDWEGRTYKWYEFGENYLHVFNVDDQTNIYATRNEDGSIFYLTVEENTSNLNPVRVDSEATEDYMGGPVVNTDAITGLSEDFYGPIALIERLYSMKDEEGTTDFVEAVTDGVYSFSYKIGESGVAVEFTFAADTYIVDYVKITADGYTTTVYEFTQSVDIINTHKPSDVLPVKYAIADTNGNALTFTDGVSAAINLTVGTHTLPFIVEPSTALVAALGINITILDETGVETWYGATASYKDGAIVLKVFTPDSYILQVTVGETVYKIPFVATYAAPKALEINTYNDMYMEYTATNATTVYTGKPLVLTAKVADGCEKGKFTATVTGENASSANFVEANYYIEEVVSYEFSSDVAGTYTVVFTSTVDASVTASITITVEAAPTFNEIAQGKYAHAESGAIVNFYPDDAENTSGIAIAEMNGTAYTFTYAIDEYGFFASGDNRSVGLDITEDYKVELTLNYYFRYVMDYVGEADPRPDDGNQGGGEANPIQGGGKLNPTTVNIQNGVYTTTVSAGAKVYFSLQNYGSSTYNVTITFEGDASMYFDGADGAQTSGSSLVVDTMDNWSRVFSFENTTATEVTVTFTITVA